MEDAPAWTIPMFWEIFVEAPSAVEDLPSWCPNFASMSGPLIRAWHHTVPKAVRQQTSSLACYEHSTGFQTVRVKVLKLDTTACCVDIACPLDDTGSKVTAPSDIGAGSTLEKMLVHWLVQLRAVSSDEGSAPGLSRKMIEFIYGTTRHESLLPLETFSETLNQMLLFADTDLDPLHVHDRRPDWAKFRETLTILSTQHGRYLFTTTSGEMGCSTRQQTPGNHVVLLPGSVRMHMLTEDCTQYCGLASLPVMSEDALLDLVIAREKMWEMVELR